MRKLIFWPVVLLLTLFIGVLTFAYLRSSFPALVQQQIAAAQTETIVVAARDIQLRRSITPSDLVEQQVAYGTVPAGAATSFDQVVGMMATSEILQGETMLTQQLAVAGVIIQQIALTLPDNKVLVPVPIQSQLISTGLVQPESRIDLFGTFVAEEVFDLTVEEASDNVLVAENTAETVAVFQNLEVHAVIIEPRLAETNGDDSENEEDGVFQSRQQGEQAILVALETQDSVIVKYLLNTEGLLDIVLRSPNDTALADVTNVDIFYLAERYGIELVREDAVVMSEEMFRANPGEFIFTGLEPSPEFLDGIGQK